MRCVAAIAVAVLIFTPRPSLAAASCPGNPNAIGTSRVIVIDPADHTRIGSMQYPESLPLRDKEVVLTFDDGPLPRYTSRILDTLAAECVKATFFMVGSMANAYPDWVRRVYNAGHTIGTHSFSHPRFFRRLSYEKGVSEIERGVTAVRAALGDERALAPFFRFPGFGSSRAFEAYLSSRGLMTWGADVPADDWKHISAEKVKERALSRLARKGRGILLLHDIQPATALALPGLLHELKARGFRIVQIVPAGPDRPKTVTEPQAWVFHRPRVPEWPVPLAKSRDEPPAFSVPSALSFGFPYPLADSITVASFDGERPAMQLPQAILAHGSKLRARTVWPPISDAQVAAAAASETAPLQGLGDVNEPSAFGGERFTPEPPVPAGHAIMIEEPKSAKVAAAPRRRPRPVRIRAANAQRQVLSPEKPQASWARSLNWFYTQQQ
jgi:peptidoglycan/xylan/chitin deacetylase (PgdA/CDA1 family)